MPAVEVGEPARGTYRYVLRRYDYDPQFPLPFNGYDEVKQPRDVTFQGRRALTIFLVNEHNRDLATKEGWIDETHEWRATQEANDRLLAAEAPAPMPAPAPIVAPAPDPASASAERKAKAATAARAR